MNSGPIEEIYFNWLYEQVASNSAPPTPSNTYLKMLRVLHNTEFVWLVSHDANRAEDGIELRKEFVRQIITYEGQDWWINNPCSVLEMLMAFSHRASFETEMTPREWFWIFLENLGIHEYTDAVLATTSLVSGALEEFIWRTYDRNGAGGLFPMHDAVSDQRKVEVWYQFCEWLVDRDII